MGQLTMQERESLNEVFSSIQTQRSPLKIVKDSLSLLITKKNRNRSRNHLRYAKYGLKRPSFFLFSSIHHQKKKNLSK